MTKESRESQKVLYKEEELSKERHLRFQAFLSDIVYKTISEVCLHFGRDCKAKERTDTQQSTGRLYLTGSLNWVLQQLLSSVTPDGKIRRGARPDADFLLDVGVENAEELKIELEAALSNALPASSIDVRSKTGIYTPRLDIYIDSIRVAEVVFLTSSASKISRFREILEQSDSAYPEDNLRTHLEAQPILIEANATEIAIVDDQAQARKIFHLGEEVGHERKLNPARLYTRENLERIVDEVKEYIRLAIIGRQEAIDLLLTVNEMTMYLQAHFYRGLCKICELGQYLPTDYEIPSFFSLNMPDDEEFFKYDQSLHTSVFSTLLPLSETGDFSITNTLDREYRHYFEKTAKYIVRAILAKPSQALLMLCHYPYMRPFQYYDRAHLMRALGWVAGFAFLKPYAPSRFNEGEYPQNIMPQAMIQAGQVIDRVKPTQFYEVVAILIAFTGVYDHDEIDRIVDTLRWPQPSDYLSVKERWGHEELEFQAGMGEEERERAKHLAKAFVQRIHPIALRKDPEENFYETGIQRNHSEEAVIVRRDGALLFKQPWLDDDEATPLPKSEQYLFIFLLTRSELIREEVSSRIEEVIEQSR